MLVSNLSCVNFVLFPLNLQIVKYYFYGFILYKYSKSQVTGNGVVIQSLKIMIMIDYVSVFQV